MNATDARYAYLQQMVLDRWERERDIRRARRAVTRAKRRRARVERLLTVPNWEHLALFILALAAVVFARSVHEDTVFRVAIQGAAVVVGVYAIVRPVRILGLHLDRSNQMTALRRAVENREAKLEELEADHAERTQ